MSSTTSAARIAANKANGLKSTGPRTPEGKARVSEIAAEAHRADAVKPRRSSVVRAQENGYGLRSERNPLDLANDAALAFEREEFLATLTGLMADLQPQGLLETRLVERLAQIDLRLQRAVRMETTHFEMQTGQPLENLPGLPGDGGYFLHAQYLKFHHPITGEQIHLEAALPSGFSLHQ